MTFLIYSLVAPVLLLPLEKVLPYPYVIEELTKYLLVTLIVKEGPRKDNSIWIYVLSAGLFFTFTESVLYIFNIISLGRYWDFPARLFLTGVLHVGTMLIMLWGINRGRFVAVIAFLIAVTIHYFFNLAIINYSI